MKLFSCQECGQLLHFSNRVCVQCGHQLGFLPDAAILLDVDRVDDGWKPAGRTDTYRFCDNVAQDACNWLIPATSTESFCVACRHNRTIPDLAIGNNLQNWRRVEQAKHHLFYSLIRMKLPLATRLEEPETGLVFDFLAEIDNGTGNPQEKVMTGHDDGVITLNLAEADDVVREQRRVSMGEPYRTLLGHFRHEIGHYYWDRLVRDGNAIDDCRAIFGDDSLDYGEALKTYYAQGPAQNWEENFVSAYASAHPWEDFAETWAHYIHIVDTIEMAGAYGLRLRPPEGAALPEIAADRFDPYREGSIEQLMEIWYPITLTVNSLNRCIGQADFYPFVITHPVIAKLGFIHNLVRNNIAAQAEQTQEAA
jgi:hypothetical protein